MGEQLGKQLQNAVELSTIRKALDDWKSQLHNNTLGFDYEHEILKQHTLQLGN